MGADPAECVTTRQRERGERERERKRGERREGEGEIDRRKMGVRGR